MLPEIYVIRHGQTEWNASGRWQGSYDSPLTERGQSQALALGGLLAAEGIATTHRLLCSPQGRARRTAELIAKAAGFPAPMEDARLREIDVGRWTGRTRAEILAEAPHTEELDWLELYTHAPGGESFEALWERVGAVLESLTGPTVLVTHGITSRFLRTRAMGWGPDRMEELPGGQGVAHRIAAGQHEELAP
ncbi:histidine phosphatase family protein [Pseudoroseicyclus sp. CXY001]|uniref:histidine phosphatase family protein n=1 Tax=Pseudoroseicyclus sp. CXY001 TaxID=3242492 RepID=UPI00358DB42D